MSFAGLTPLLCKPSASRLVCHACLSILAIDLLRCECSAAIKHMAGSIRKRPGCAGPQGG